MLLLGIKEGLRVYLNYQTFLVSSCGVSTIHDSRQSCKFKFCMGESKSCQQVWQSGFFDWSLKDRPVIPVGISLLVQYITARFLQEWQVYHARQRPNRNDCPTLTALACMLLFQFCYSEQTLYPKFLSLSVNLQWRIKSNYFYLISNHANHNHESSKERTLANLAFVSF